MLALLQFAVGLLALLVAARLVVVSAAHLGARLGLTPLVVGLTIVALGTSAPELAVVGQAVVVDDTDLAVGSIIGSNIANVLAVLGLAATLGALQVTSRLVRTDVPVMIAASGLFLVLAWDGRLGRLDGLALLAGAVGFVAWTVIATRRAEAGTARPQAAPWGLTRSCAAMAVGIAGLALSSRLVVRGAEELAIALGVPELVVGLSIVALGTSAPEIVTTFVAARRGDHDLAVGNAIGTNILNLTFVLGAVSFVAPSGLTISPDALRLDAPIMLAVAFACVPVLAWDHRLSRAEGALFVSYYLAYVAFLVLDETGHRAAKLLGVTMIGFVVPLTVITVATLAYRSRGRRAENRVGSTPISNKVNSRRCVR